MTRSQTTTPGEYAELAGLFFLQSMAMGMWFVPMSTVLEGNGFGAIRPFAFATSAVAAFVSPLVFGAMADRHVSPLVVLRGIAAASALSMGVVTWGIKEQWPAGLVLVLIQFYALFAIPTGSIASTIVLSRLHNSQRQFGPVRAAATFGWMVGCWIISGLNADTSWVAGLAGALAWLALSLFTFLLPGVPPPPSSGPVSLKQRMGWDALALLRLHDHKVVFITAALFSIPISAFYPYTPPHLQHLGFEHTSAWMSLGQVMEIVAMFALGTLFSSWRLKWIFGAGLAFGLARYMLFAFDDRLWLLSGILLHGLTFTLFFVTAQIYLNERVDAAWRARAQALMWLMTGGVGNLIGYLGTGAWFRASGTLPGQHWSWFWGLLAVLVAMVMAYFLIAYHGKGPGFRRPPPARDSSSG